MRIGIDIRALMEGRITGVQVYITNLLKALFEIDQENEYVLFGNLFKNAEFKMFDVEYENLKHKIFHYPNKLFIPAQKYLGYPKVDKLLGGVDLFFSPHWRVTALDPALPLVVTFHDLAFEIMPEFFTLKQRLWHKFMNYREATKRATKIVAVSEATKNDLKDIYQVPEKKIVVIHSGCRNPVSSPGRSLKVSVTNHRDAVVPVSSLPFFDKYFLYLGTFEPRKNIQTVVAAYEQYYKMSDEKWPLVLAGSSGWKVKLQVPPALRSKIAIFQNVSEEEKKRLFGGAFAFLFLSFYEGFGFPILEAASRGVPVISSFAASLLEIGHEFALFVNPFRTIQVAQAMIALEEEPNLWQNMSKQGFAVAKKFGWEEAARKTLELFNSVINSSSYQNYADWH